MILTVGVSVKLDFKATGAAKHFIVENIITIVLGSNVREELAKHGHKESQLFGHLLQVALKTNVADSVGWLVEEVNLDISNHLDFTVCERDLLRNVTE